MREAVDRVGAVRWKGYFWVRWGVGKREIRRTYNPWRNRYRIRGRVGTLSISAFLRISNVKPNLPTRTHSINSPTISLLIFFRSYSRIGERTVANKAPLAPTLGIPVLVKFPPNTNP